MVRRTIDIDRTLWHDVGVASAMLGITKREFVEQALREHLEKTRANSGESLVGGYAFDVGRSEAFAFEEVVQKAPTVEDVAEETLQEMPEPTRRQV